MGAGHDRVHENHHFGDAVSNRSSMETENAADTALDAGNNLSAM